MYSIFHELSIENHTCNEHFLEKKVPNNCRLLFATWMVFIFPKMSETDGDGKDAGRFPLVLLIGNSVGQLGTSGVNMEEGKQTFLQCTFHLK